MSRTKIKAPAWDRMMSIIHQFTDDTGYKCNLEFYVTSYYDSLLEHTSDISHLPYIHH